MLNEGNALRLYAFTSKSTTQKQTEDQTPLRTHFWHFFNHLNQYAVKINLKKRQNDNLKKIVVTLIFFITNK